MIELALVLAVLGVLLLPLTQFLSQMRDAKRLEATNSALQLAKEALLNYAAHNRGCLPHAADFEGGMPDTGLTGTGSYTDTGSARQAVEPAGNGAGQRAGDLPWADLALNGRALDARQHRLQYYVASALTAPRQTRASNDNKSSRVGCPARSRSGLESWQAQTPYRQGDIVSYREALYVATGDAASDLSPPAAPWQIFGPLRPWQEVTAYNTGDYVAYNNRFYRALSGNSAMNPQLSNIVWRETGLPDGREPPLWQSHATEGYRRGELALDDGIIYRVINNAAPPGLSPSGSNSWERISLTENFLATRSGPVISTAPGNTIVAARNAFVLISPGADSDAVFQRPAMRDENHLICLSNNNCNGWTTLNDANVDSRTFSLSSQPMPSPDTVLAVSFAEYQSALHKAGISIQMVGY